LSIRPCPYPRCADHDGQPVLTGDGVCESCRYSVERDLTSAPYYYVQLHLELIPSRSPTEKVSGSKTPPLPLRLTMLTAANTYAEVLTEWESVVAKAENLSTPSTWVRESFAVQRAAKLLTPRIRSACQYSPDHALALQRTSIVARRLLGLTRVTHRLAATCPNCACFGLRREDGSSLVRCVQCNSAWTEDVYTRLEYATADSHAPA
jgi:ribosomal protein L37AE/L43A